MVSGVPQAFDNVTAMSYCHCVIAQLLSALFIFSLSTHASVVSADTVSISTFVGRTSSNGITISTSIYLAASNSISLDSAGGHLSGSSSVTASAFFGDGSHLSGVARLSADNTFSGASTFTSSFSVQSGGRRISLSTGSTYANVEISSFGVVSFSPEMHNSSSTVLAAYSTTSTGFGPCITGSTLTITTSGGRVQLTFVGATSSFPSGVPRLSFLQDGQFIASFTTGTAIGGNASHYLETTPFNYLVDAAAGQHSFCATLATPGGGTATLNGTGSSTPVANQFFIKEIK